MAEKGVVDSSGRTLDSSNTVLVTGGAGFIGRHLVKRLNRESSCPVVLVDNLSRAIWQHSDEGAEGVQFQLGDIRDHATVAEAMNGCDIVFHLAAQSNVLGAVRDIEYSFSTNVQGTFNVLRAARERGVKRVIFTSSREVYGDSDGSPVAEATPLQPRNAYGASKASGEMYCRIFNEGNLEVAVLRLANAYGPGDADRVIPLFVENALMDRPLVLYGGNQVLDFVWIETVVDALMKAAFGAKMQGPVNIGSGKGVTIADLARRIIALTESRSVMRVEPRREAEVACFVANVDRACEHFGIQQPEDPLFGLPSVIEFMKSRLVAAARA